MLLSDILKKEMKTRGLEIADIAEITGLTYQKIYSYVNGSVPKNKDLKILCEAMGVDVDDISLDKKRLSVSEAAKFLEVSNGVVKAMVNHGLFGWTDGSYYHIPRMKVEEYIGIRNSIDIKQFIGILSYAMKDIGTEIMKEVITEELGKQKKSNFSQKLDTTN